MEKELDPGRAFSRFAFVITEAKQFYKDRKPRMSAPFFCRNLLWRISVKHNKRDNGDFLSVYVGCTSSFAKHSFSVKARVEYRIVAQVEGVKDKVDKFTNTFEPGGLSFGEASLIDWEFFDPQSGFRRNDSFLIEVEVNAELPVGRS